MQAQSVQHSPSANDDLYPWEGVDEIIAEHGGDAREAIRELLGKITFLEAARDRALNLVSFGYARGKVDDR